MKTNTLSFLYISIFLFGFLITAQNKKTKINIDSVFYSYASVSDSKEKVEKLIYLYKKSVKQGKTEESVYKAKCFNSLGVTYRKPNLEKEAF